VAFSVVVQKWFQPLMKQRKGNLSYHTTNYFVSYVGKESLKKYNQGMVFKRSNYFIASA
jgi:hypothetical protein